jgi:hypothetical protein
LAEQARDLRHDSDGSYHYVSFWLLFLGLRPGILGLHFEDIAALLASRIGINQQRTSRYGVPRYNGRGAGENELRSISLS